MENELVNMFFKNALNAKNDIIISEILDTNKKSSEIGLVLSESDAKMLAAESNSLIDTMERVEFGKSATVKIINKFMNSSYISQTDYVDTLCSLIEIFYEAKDESNDILTDDEVIDIMYYYFENVSQGSTELLQTRDMESLCRKIRNDENL